MLIILLTISEGNSGSSVICYILIGEKDKRKEMMKPSLTLASGVGHWARNGTIKWDLQEGVRGRVEYKEFRFCTKTLHWLSDFLVIEVFRCMVEIYT